MKNTLNFQKKNNFIPLSKIFQKILNTKNCNNGNNYYSKIFNFEYNITINYKEYPKVCLWAIVKNIQKELKEYLKA